MNHTPNDDLSLSENDCQNDNSSRQVDTLEQKYSSKMTSKLAFNEVVSGKSPFDCNSQLLVEVHNQQKQLFVLMREILSVCQENLIDRKQSTQVLAQLQTKNVLSIEEKPKKEKKVKKEKVEGEEEKVDGEEEKDEKDSSSSKKSTKEKSDKKSAKKDSEPEFTAEDKKIIEFLTLDKMIGGKDKKEEFITEKGLKIKQIQNSSGPYDSAIEGIVKSVRQIAQEKEIDISEAQEQMLEILIKYQESKGKVLKTPELKNIGSAILQGKNPITGK